MSNFGAHLILGFRGHRPEDTEPRILQEYLRQELIGGVILFGCNIEGATQVQELTQSFLEASPHTSPYIAIDQEGGRVQRLNARNGFHDFPSAFSVAQDYTAAQACDLYRDMAKDLKNAGFNLNFGPVVDLSYPQDSDKVSSAIGAHGRSYGETVEKVVPYARSFIESHRQEGILTCLKHYPGHGLALGDSHQGMVDITTTYQNYEEETFIDLSKSGHADMIMVAHLMNFDLDPNFPSSLSPATLKKLRRFYEGVVISDDLHMGAILKNFSLEITLQQVLKSGVDILIFSNNKAATGGIKDFQGNISEVEKIHEIVARLIQQDESYGRTLALSHHRLKNLNQLLKDSASTGL